MKHVRDVEQVGDQSGLCARVPLDRLEPASHLLRREPPSADELHPAENRVERGAKLVRDRGEKAILQLVGALGGRQRVLRMLERLGACVQRLAQPLARRLVVSGRLFLTLDVSHRFSQVLQFKINTLLGHSPVG